MVSRQRRASRESVRRRGLEGALPGLRTKLDCDRSNSVKTRIVGVGMVASRVTTVANRSDMTPPVHRLDEAAQRNAVGHEARWVRVAWRWWVVEAAAVVDVPTSACPQQGHPFAPGDIPSVISSTRLKKTRGMFTYTITLPSHRIGDKAFDYLNVDQIAQGSMDRKNIRVAMTCA